MESVAVHAAARTGRLPRLIDVQALSAWVLSGTLVLYLGFNGGGYAFSTYGQAGIVLWWIVVITCAWGLLPATALSRMALVAIATFGAFTVWTALGITWSISTGRSFQDLALVTSYFGLLVLAVAIHRERDQAMRHTLAAVGSAITVIAAVAVATRLWPDFIPSARTLLEGTSRLSWPLDYWNALASLTVLGIPVLLSIATSARRLALQALAAGAIPIVALCGALTQSRGGVVACGVALLVWLICVPERVPKLATGALVAAGSTAVVAGGLGDRAIRLAQRGALEHHQAEQLVWAIILISLGVAIAQLGLGRLIRHATPPRALSPSRRVAAAISAAAVAVMLVVALIVGVPHKLSHLWNDFKSPVNHSQSLSHFAATSGGGRYQYWVAGIDSAKQHVLTGSGPGTFQLDWLPRAHISSYVVNAHSLYVETYTELGLIGLTFLAAFIIAILTACIRVVATTSGDARTRAAGVTAAIVAFFTGAAFDWLWQLPVLVAIVLLLAGALLAPARHRVIAQNPGTRHWFSGRRGVGAGVAILGLAALAAVAYPLSVNTDVANSQAAVNAGNQVAALTDARAAVQLESGSAEAEIQLALVLEEQHDLSGALTAALRATTDESQNWTNWLTLSQIEAADGQARASVRAYQRAKSLNPESSLFAA